MMQTIYSYFPAVFYTFVLVFGCVIGSFLNVVIYRLPRGLDFVRGRSACPSCGRTLSWAEMAPVVSRLILRGKCKGCGAGISPRYAIIELMTGIASITALCVWGPTLRAVLVFAIICGLILVAFIDMDTMEIPNGLILYLLIPAAGLVFVTPEVSYLSHGIGLICVSVPMLLLSMAIPNAFGGGDIKLMAVCGLALGWQYALFAMFAAILLGGAQAVWMLARRKAERGSLFAFGPHLAAGTALALLTAGPVIDWYTGFFM